MAWTTANIPSLTGKTAVVTGANGGLGLESVKALAGAGAHVVMAARSPQKPEIAVAEILAAYPDASLEVVPLDLASQSAVKAAAAAIVAAHPTVDILLNNAGLMAMPEGRTADGYETQFGVNHLGHWTFTAKLLPSLIAEPAARVVTTTSIARHQGKPVNPENPHLEGEYEEWKAYGQSKLANLVFALGLQRDFAAAGVAAISLAAHPGLSHTDLQKRTVRDGGGDASGPAWEERAEKWGMPAWRGALPQLRAATDPRAKGGEFYGPATAVRGNAVRLHLYTRSRLLAQVENLWTISQNITGIALDVEGVRARP